MADKSLEIRVLYCKDLRAFNFFQKLSVYAFIYISMSITEDSSLKRRQSIGMLGDKRIGEVRVPLSEVKTEGRGSVRFVSYQVKNTEGKPNGALRFSYKFGGGIDGDSIGKGFASTIAGFPIVHPVEETSGSSGIRYPKIDWEEPVVEETSYYPPPGTRCHPLQALPPLGYPIQTAAGGGGGCYYPGAQPMPAFGPWQRGHHHGYRYRCSTRGGGGWWRM